MKTIDEQLEDALARVKQLEADALAGTTLLNEAAKTSGDLKAQAVALIKEKDGLATEKETLARLTLLPMLRCKQVRHDSKSRSPVL